MFRKKTGVDLPENEQGYIYYQSMLYKKLPRAEKQRINRAAEEAGGEDYAKALMEFVTTRANATYICEKHNLSKSTLYRAYRKYYAIMAKMLWVEGKK